MSLLTNCAATTARLDNHIVQDVFKGEKEGSRECTLADLGCDALWSELAFMYQQK